MKKIKKKELISLLKKKENLGSYNLKDANFSRLDLSKQDLSNLDFSGTKFKKSRLEQVNFKGSILMRACFSKANLEEANLRETICSYADFSNACLCRADLTRANLKDIIVYKTKMKRINLNEANLEGNDLTHTDLSNSTARKANFKGTNLNSSCLNKADFKEANFEGANLSDIKAKQTIFSACSLVKANLEGSVLNGAYFSRADLTDANLSLASLYGIAVDGAKLKQINFKYSIGLSEEKEQYLRQEGVKISVLENRIMQTIKFIFTTKWAFAALIAFIITLIVIGYFNLMDINKLSIPALKYKYRQAKLNNQYQKALELGSLLIKKYEQSGDNLNVFNKKLEKAKIYRILGETEKSLTHLKSMFIKYSDDLEKKARINIELARLHIESGHPNQAIPLLEDVKDFKLEKKTFYSVEMNLALAYRKSNKPKEAKAIYLKLLKTYEDYPELIANIRKKIKTF